MTIFILLAFFCRHYTDGRCTPQDCQVSSWTFWSSCYGERCGGRGVQRRIRWQDIVPSCGGSECPILEETRSCGSELTKRDCQLSSWSPWSTCSTRCGVSGVESSSRYKVITEQCGGYCPSILNKTRPCFELSCLNGGRLNHNGTCSCADGYSGECCEEKSDGIVKNVFFACTKILNLFISISNSYSLFLSYSFGTETINTLIHSRSSLENPYPIPETLPFVAAHTYMTYGRKYPPLGCILSKIH